MRNLPLTPIYEALERLNTHYGKGYISEVDYTGSTFVQQPHGMRPERKRFTAVETADQTTVYALGHQKTIYHATTYEVRDHGVDHAQYFQGCGTSYTDFDIVFTGAGSTGQEAYSDALDQAAMSGYDIEGIKAPAFGSYRVPASHEEHYRYVSVRMKDSRKIS